MASLKKFLLDYGLYFILTVSSLRFLIIFYAGGTYHADELFIAVLQFGLILAFIYIQWDAKKSANAHALGLTHVAHNLAQSNADIARKLKFKTDAKQEVADRGRESAEGAMQFAE